MSVKSNSHLLNGKSCMQASGILFDAKTHCGFHGVSSIPPSRILSGSLLNHKLVVNPVKAVFQ